MKKYIIPELRLLNVNLAANVMETLSKKDADAEEQWTGRQEWEGNWDDRDWDFEWSE